MTFFVRVVLAVAVAWLISYSVQGFAQAPSPAQMGISATATPQVLQTLDRSQTWVPIGTVDPASHSFAVSNMLASAPTNAALKAMPSTYPAVRRLGYYAPGDGGDAAYNASGSACPFAAGAGDGFSQVPTSDGKCWLISLQPGMAADVRAAGAYCDATTNDASAFKAILAAGHGLVVPLGKTCIAGNIDVNGMSVSGGGTIKAPTTGANYVFHLSGVNASIHDVAVQDGDGTSNPVLNTQATTTTTSPLIASVAAAGIANGGSGWAAGVTGCTMVDSVTNGVASTPAQFTVNTSSTGVISAITAVSIAGAYTVLPGESVGNTQQIFSEPVNTVGGSCGSGAGATFALTFTTSTSVTVASTAATSTASAVQVGQRFAVKSDDGVWSSGMIVGVSGATITFDRAPRHPAASGAAFNATFGSVYVGGVGPYSGNCSSCNVRNVNMIQGGLMIDSDQANSVTGFASDVYGGGHVFCAVVGRNTFGWQASRINCGTHWNPGDMYASDGVNKTFRLSQRTRKINGLFVYVNGSSTALPNNPPVDYAIAKDGQSITFVNPVPNGQSVRLSYQAMAADGLVINGPGPIVANVQALGFDRAFYFTGPQSPQLSDLIADASIEACFSLDGTANASFGGANSVGFCDTGFYLVNNSHASFRTTSGAMGTTITPQGQANAMIMVDALSAVNDGEWTIGGTNYYRAISYQSAYTQMNEIAVNSLPIPQYGVGCPISGAALPGIWNYCGNTGDHAYFNSTAHVLSFDGVDAPLTSATANTINAPGVPAVLELRAMGTGSQINLSANNNITLGVATTTGGNGFPTAVAVVNSWGVRFAAPVAFASLPACDATHRGLALVNDSTTNAVGWPIVGGGASMVLAWCSGGSNSWSVAASSTVGSITGYAIANLPACDTAHKGLTTYVTNGVASPVYLAAVSTTGSVIAPVFCNGTAWIYS